MLYIKAEKEDKQFFEKLCEEYPQIIMSSSKNFDGSSEIVEVFIELSPVILSSITIIVHDILHYMKAKYKSKEDNKSEISIEKKMPDGEYKVLIKSSKIDDVEETIQETVRQIKKL